VNATAAALLGLLHGGAMTGGQLVSAAVEQFGSFFSVTRSQVYRELPTLADAGLVRLGAQGPRASQQYAITAAGKRAFKSWLTAGGGADALRRAARRDQEGRARRARSIPEGRRRLRRGAHARDAEAAGRHPVQLIRSA
jgi:DNA-binding PadR family transcriptional regulator